MAFQDLAQVELQLSNLKVKIATETKLCGYAYSDIPDQINYLIREIAQFDEQMETLRNAQKSTGSADSANCRLDNRALRDLLAGHSVREVWRKQKGRERARAHRRAQQQMRTRQFLDRERDWHEKHDTTPATVRSHMDMLECGERCTYD